MTTKIVGARKLESEWHAYGSNGKAVPPSVNGIRSATYSTANSLYDFLPQGRTMFRTYFARVNRASRHRIMLVIMAIIPFAQRLLPEPQVHSRTTLAK